MACSGAINISHHVKPDTQSPQRPAASGHLVQVNGIELYYEERGAGWPLVLVHGFGGCGQNWEVFAGELAERYRLIIVDLRGHGRSTNPGNTFTHRAAAGDVLQLLDTLGVQQFSAMGISSGGMVLLHIAASRPERIAAMVLISATTHFPDQARDIMRIASFDRMPLEVRTMYRASATRGDEQIRQLIAQFNALAGNHDDMDFSAQSLSAVTARTLVVHGDRDRFFPLAIAQNMSRWIPSAALWVIPGGEHVPIYDAAVPFAATALRFLDGQGA